MNCSAKHIIDYNFAIRTISGFLCGTSLWVARVAFLFRGVL